MCALFPATAKSGPGIGTSRTIVDGDQETQSHSRRRAGALSTESSFQQRMVTEEGRPALFRPPAPEADQWLGNVGETQPLETKPLETKPVQTKAGETRAGDSQSTEKPELFLRRPIIPRPAATCEHPST